MKTWAVWLSYSSRWDSNPVNNDNIGLDIDLIRNHSDWLTLSIL